MLLRKIEELEVQLQVGYDIIHDTLQCSRHSHRLPPLLPYTRARAHLPSLTHAHGRTQEATGTTPASSCVIYVGDDTYTIALAEDEAGGPAGGMGMGDLPVSW